MKQQVPAIGVIGGSGLYQMEGLHDPTEHAIDTPFGPPSDLIFGGKLGERQVYFLPRHARGHRILPHELNHRANIFALRSLHVRWILCVTAVGSLQERFAPRDVLLPTQFYDRTSGRAAHTFFGEGIAAHVSFADPISAPLRNLIAEAARSLGITVHNGGTYVNMDGPAFSTRAESELNRRHGFDVIGMTNLPEAKLAREAEIALATMAMITDYVDELVAKKRNRRFDDPRFSIVDTEEEDGSQNTIREQTISPRQATAFVSIMQGCNMHCTFCIVPQTRGSERSRPIHEIVAEVRRLVASGVREVTLLGQIVNLYGRHEFPTREGKSPFVQLLEAVHAIEGLERLRFTSPHPVGFRDDLIGAFANLPKLAEHVHLPLQSGSNRILRAMHRAYTAEKYAGLVQRLRAARDGIALTTDVIVGFPGETEADYGQTRDLVESIDFDNAFVFRYSPRRDTPAAEIEEQVPEETKEERNRDLLEVVNGSARRAGERLVGRDVEVLCEGRSRYNPARLTGRTRTNKIVVFEGLDELAAQLLTVRVKHANDFSLYGEPVLP